MKKIISKIAGGLLGLSLALGVGVAVRNVEKTNKVEATTYTILATLDLHTGAPSGSTSTQLTNDTLKAALNANSSVSGASVSTAR